MRNIILALAISMFLGAFAINFALADVTGAGSTTNTQSTTGTSATNTAITGGYHSEATTNYQTGSSQNTTTTNTTNTTWRSHISNSIP